MSQWQWNGEQHPDKEIIPAAILYYHVSDPMITPEREDTPEIIGEKIRKQLRTTGIVNDSAEVINLLDKEFADKSDVIPVQRKKDGSYTVAPVSYPGRIMDLFRNMSMTGSGNSVNVFWMVILQLIHMK